MCLNPITIINPSKVVSVNYRDRFLLQVPCGKCADCQRNKSNEWLFRAMMEFQQALENKAFAYFDTLTYDNAHLPTLDKMVDNILPSYPCFSGRDINLFFKRLRQNLKRKYGEVKVRYMLTSEYGSKTQRPHYHILTFVSGKITPVQFSKMIAISWQNGRTDGIPWKSSSYVLWHNTLDMSSQSIMIRTSNYITKYIQKDCYYSDLIDKRVKHCDVLLSDIQGGRLSLHGVAFERIREKVRNCVNSFSRVSVGFGEIALRDLDLAKLFDDGCLWIAHPKLVKMPVALPTYYKRKLFYDQYEVDGAKTWQLTELGNQYKQYRDNFNLEQLASRLSAMALHANIDINALELSDYILHKRGRYVAGFVESTLEDRLNNPTHYVYSTRSDKQNVGCGISLDWIGNSSIGYAPFTNKIRFKDFIDKFVYLNQQNEAILEKLYSSVSFIRKGKQDVYQREQELRALLKTICAPRV